MYEPENLNRWTPDGPTAFDSRANYAGSDLSEYYVAAGTNRDADTLRRSNWECITRDLLPFDREHGDNSSTVYVARFGHWACGWYELLLIHESNGPALELADEIAGASSDYPVYDDEHFSETEQQEADETWLNCYNWEERVKYVKKFREQFEFHDFADMLNCIRGKYFCGYASELIY